MSTHHTAASRCGRIVAAMALVVGTSAAVFVTSTSAGDDTKEIKVRDECEPDSFNAALGPGACVGDGDVTFEELLATLTPEIGGHDKWRQPTNVDTKVGRSLKVVNRGGEFHSFTEVANFGAGVVPELNAALPPDTPAAVPVGPFNGIDAGGSITLSGFTKGTHLFQCMIHPWMRTTLVVKPR